MAIDVFKLVDDIRSGLGFGDNAVKKAVRSSSGGRGSSSMSRGSKSSRGATSAREQYKANKAAYRRDVAASKKKKKAVTPKRGSTKYFTGLTPTPKGAKVTKKQKRAVRRANRKAQAR